MVNKEYYVEVLRSSGRDFAARGQNSSNLASGTCTRTTHPPTSPSSYLTETGIKTAPHPPYSPDLAPCDFWMFPRLKEKLRGRRFEDVEEMKEAVTEALDTFPLEDYQRAFKKWLECYNKCIELGGSYFDGD